jgi:hypothetical protein
VAEDKIKPALPKFISDDAVSEDYFGSHQPVAESIATVIRTDPNLRVIGLMGPWGSGKSTVLRILQGIFAKNTSEDDTRFFVYDAWAHQSDPPRRSFLETLVGFLVSQKLLTKSDWQDDLDRLNRRLEEHDSKSTPTLTGSGKLIAITLLLFPIGLALLNDAGWIDKEFSPFGYDTGLKVLWLTPILFLTPFLAASIVYLCWRPQRHPFNAKFWQANNWTSHRHPYENDSIFSLFVNRTVDRVVNRVVRTPDPTAIEFQETYHRIMRAVSAPNRRFVFVVDNLDRIPETEAVSLWSTVRSFFLGRTNEIVPLENGLKFTPPVVILPLDPQTVTRMYGDGGSEDHDLAQSFIDKTFDLVFRVAPPIVSDWESYLSRKLEEAFGSQITDDDVYAIKRLYSENLGARTVTPREIIKFVNQIVALRLQHKSKVGFIPIAYYSMHKRSIEQNIQTISNLSDALISRFDEDWRSAVAAIFYNVEVDKALQVLIAPQFHSAIIEGSEQVFSKLAKIPGAITVLEKLFESLADQKNPAFVANAALLIESSKIEASPQLRAIYSSLRGLVDPASTWTSISEKSGLGLSVLLRNCPVANAKDFRNIVVQSLSHLSAELLTGQETAIHWSLAIEKIREISQTQSLPEISVNVPGDAGFFLRVMDAAKGKPQLIAHLSPTVGADAVVQALASSATSSKFSAPLEHIIEALQNTPTPWKWDSLIAAAGQFVEQDSSSEPATSNALRLLVRLQRPNKVARNELKRLADAGVLFDRFYQAHTNKHIEVETSLIAAIILSNPGLAHPTAIGNSENGLSLFRDLATNLADRAEIYPKIDAQLKSYGQFIDLINAADATKALRPFVRKVFDTRVQSNALGRLHVADVLERLQKYLQVLDPILHDNFLLQLAEYETFWEELAKRSLDAHSVRVLKVLVEQADDLGDKSRADLAARVGKFSSEEWQRLLETEEESLPIITRLAHKSLPPPDFGEPLSKALHEVLYKAIAGSEFSETLVQRWFDAAKLIDDNNRELLFKDVRDRVLSASSLPTQILSVGGSELLTGGQFEAKSDEAVRHIVAVALNDLKQNWKWLSASRAESARWIQGADVSTRSYMTDRLAAHLAEADDDSRLKLEELATAWHLPTQKIGEKESGEVVDK